MPFNFVEMRGRCVFLSLSLSLSLCLRVCMSLFSRSLTRYFLLSWLSLAGGAGGTPDSFFGACPFGEGMWLSTTSPSSLVWMFLVGNSAISCPCGVKPYDYSGFAALTLTSGKLSCEAIDIFSWCVRVCRVRALVDEYLFDGTRCRRAVFGSSLTVCNYPMITANPTPGGAYL